MKALVLSAMAVSFLILGCESPVRKAMYSAYETVGVEKRDILRRRVDKARDEQKDAGESFKDALEEFKKLYSFDGGSLEKQYRKMKDAYEDSEEDAKEVRTSIASMDQVAKDLFKEWESEIANMEAKDLRDRSSTLRRETKTKYDSLFTALKKSEAKMEPVLKKLHDQVLFLKHGLNAKAIASLKGQAVHIEGDIEKLMTEMNAAIREADAFIADLK